MDIDTAMVLRECVNIKFEKKEDKEVANVCKGLEDWLNEKEENGKRNITIKHYVDGYLPFDVALEDSGLSKDEFLKAVEEYKNQND